MALKMTIAILGFSGNAGLEIAKNLLNSNHRLLVMFPAVIPQKELEHALNLINSAADVEFMKCPIESSWEADLIIVALTMEEIEIVKQIKEVAAGKIVISITDRNEGADNRKKIQELLPYSLVISATNTKEALDTIEAKIELHYN